MSRAREWTAACSVVRRTARDGRLHRRVPRASRRDHAVAAAPGRDAMAEARARRRTLAQSGRRSGAAAALYQRGRAASPARRVRERRSGVPQSEPSWDANRNRGSRCCGWTRDAPTPQRRRSAVSSSATTDRLQRARLLPAYVEIMLAAGDVHEARGACDELEDLAATFDIGRAATRSPRTRTARSQLAEGDARPRSARCAARSRVAADRGALRSRPHAGARRAGLPRARRRRGGAGSSSTRPVRCSSGSARRRDLARLDALGERAVPAQHRLDRARASGAAPGRRRQDQQGDRGRVVPQRDARSTGT